MRGFAPVTPARAHPCNPFCSELKLLAGSFKAKNRTDFLQLHAATRVSGPGGTHLFRRHHVYITIFGRNKYTSYKHRNIAAIRAATNRLIIQVLKEESVLMLKEAQQL